MGPQKGKGKKRPDFDPKFEDWNGLSKQYEGETNRGAAVLAAGFADYVLSSFMKYNLTNKRKAKELFGTSRPLGSFGAKILAGEAFGIIGSEEAHNLNMVREIRNYFAHEPMECTFDDPPISGLVDAIKLPVEFEKLIPVPIPRRMRYVMAIALFCAPKLAEMERNPRP